MTLDENCTGLLSSVAPEKVVAMKAEFHADRERNHSRRVAIARTMRLLCAPIEWWRIYGETFAEVMRPAGRSL